MKKQTKSIVAGVSALLILALGIGALGTATKGFQDWDTKNWGDNFNNLIPKEDGTQEKLDTLDVNQTDSAKTYLMPKSSVNFGNSLMNDDVSNEQVVKTVQENKALEVGTISTMGVKDEASLFNASNPLTFPQVINLKATVTPEIEDSKLDVKEWTLSWSASENINDYIILENASNSTSCTLKVLKAFSTTATLKVKVGKGGFNVEDSCSIEFYKQCTGIDLQMTGGVADKVLNAGDQITYAVNETYSAGTIDQKDNTDVVVSYNSNISDYTINYDFKKNEKTAFSYGEFYNSTDNFTGVNVLTGAGRNKMNAKLMACDGDFIITADKGTFTKQVIMDVEAETTLYPESVQIGNGEDIEIGKDDGSGSETETSFTLSVYGYWSNAGINGTYDETQYASWTVPNRTTATTVSELDTYLRSTSRDDFGTNDVLNASKSSIDFTSKIAKLYYYDSTK